MTPTKGTFDTCKQCGRVAKMCARGLCNSCYDKDIKSRKIRKCKRCGDIGPHHSHGLCEKCYSNYRYHKDPDDWNGKTKERYKKNPEKFRVRDHARNKTTRRIEWQQKHNQEQYIKNREARIAYQKKYRADHPGFVTHHSERRKARVANLPYDLTEDQWQNILKEYNYSCAYCGASDVSLHREHKIPVCRGGGYTASNIVPACPTCNMRKHNKTDTEFIDFLKKFPR